MAGYVHQLRQSVSRYQDIQISQLYDYLKERGLPNFIKLIQKYQHNPDVQMGETTLETTKLISAELEEADRLQRLLD